MSSTRGQKRKSDIAPSANDDEQLVAKAKKAKSANPSDPNLPTGKRPTPRPTSRVLKAQLPASRKRTSLSESGVAIETAKEQVTTRKRPAEGEVVDEAPVPSKKVRGSNTNTNISRPLKHTGSFFTSELEDTEIF